MGITVQPRVSMGGSGGGPRGRAKLWIRLVCESCSEIYTLRRTAWFDHITTHGDQPPCPKCHPRKQAVPKCVKCGRGQLSIKPVVSGGDGLCGWCRRGRVPNPYGVYACPTCKEPRWCFRARADRPCLTCRLDAKKVEVLKKPPPPRNLPVAGPPDPFNTRWIVFPCCQHRLSTNVALTDPVARTCPGCRHVFPRVVQESVSPLKTQGKSGGRPPRRSRER